jgi:hypothetical protein
MLSMIRARFGMALALAGLLVTAGAASADVKKTEKTQMKFEGMLGRVMGMFGGKSMKDGIVSTVMVKGDRKVTATDDSAEIIDLAEQKIYEVNIKDKSYRVVTFAEMKKRMEEARAKAEESARKQQAREQKRDPDQKELEIEFSAKETGQKRQIAGYNCREIVVTITMHEKGKTLDQAGGMVLASSQWLAPRIAALKEIQDFDQRYAKAMAESLLPSAEEMAQAFAMYPGMKDAMARMQKESVNMDGTAIESTTSFQTVMTKEQATSAKKEEGGSSSPGGALGGMLGRLGRKKEEPKPAEGGTTAAAAASDTRVTIMTATSSLLTLATSVSADDVAVPATFKLKK